MPEKFELERLKKDVDSAFNVKQKAYERYNYLRVQTNEAYDEMQRDWENLVEAKDRLDREYNVIYDGPSREIWENFAEFKKKTHAEIEALKREVETEKHKMDRCFAQAKSAYEYGDKGDAPLFSQRAHEHKEAMNELSKEIKAKCQAITEARMRAEREAPRSNSAEFDEARIAFEEAKERHQASRTKFLHYKRERNYLKDKFDNAKTLYNCERDRYLRKVGADCSDEEDPETEVEENGTSDPEKGGGFFHKILTTLFG